MCALRDKPSNKNQCLVSWETLKSNRASNYKTNKYITIQSFFDRLGILFRCWARKDAGPWDCFSTTKLFNWVRFPKSWNADAIICSSLFLSATSSRCDFYCQICKAQKRDTFVEFSFFVSSAFSSRRAWSAPAVALANLAFPSLSFWSCFLTSWN